MIACSKSECRSQRSGRFGAWRRPANTCLSQSVGCWVAAASMMVLPVTDGKAAEPIVAESVLIRLIDEVDVPARALGPLTEVFVEEGTVVKKGDVLAQIDDSEALLDQQHAERQVAIAEHQASEDVEIRSAEKTAFFSSEDYLRLKRSDDAKPRTVSKSELEKSRLEAEQARLKLEKAKREQLLAELKQQLAANDLARAKRNVDIRKIRAPLDGVVVSVSHQAGEWVKPGDRMFRIVRTDRLRAEGFVDASAVTGDLRGVAVTLWPQSGGGKEKFSGKVSFVSNEVDPVNRQVRIWAEVENPDGLLRSGQRAKMTILSERGEK